MRIRASAVSLVDLLVACTLIGLVSAFVIPTTARVRELSKRSVCAINLAGIGAANRIYAESNNGSWPVPAFKNSTIDQQGIYYNDCDRTLPGSGHFPCDRRFESRSETPTCPNCGSTEVAVTRAYWMMVRSGAITTKQFVCPSSGDVPDPTEVVDAYYDFTRISNISFGYMVPFGPRDTRPREGMDHRQVIAADKGPWYLPSIGPNWNVGPQGLPISLNDPPIFWRRFNSPNHGGSNSGEGQNVLFGDGNVSFVRIPAVGVDNDNIYTKMTNEWNTFPNNLIYGEAPHEPPDPPYPGQDVFGNGAGRHSTTDSLIYP